MPPYESLVDHFGDLPVEDGYSLPQLLPPSRQSYATAWDGTWERGGQTRSEEE